MVNYFVGGIITIILKHPALAICFPPGLDVIEGETRLTTNIFQNMHLFHTDYETEAIYWAVDSRDSIKNETPPSPLLRLSNPIHNTV